MVELFASVTQPKIALPRVPVRLGLLRGGIVYPLPRARSASGTPIRFLELVRGYMIPVERQPFRFASLYYPSGVDRPRDPAIDRVAESSSELWISSIPVADKGTVVASMFTS